MEFHDINKEYNEQYKFWKIWCDEGHLITTFNEGDDILNYSSFTIAYAPQNADLTIYHCVTVEEDEEYKARQEDERKKQRPE